MINLGCYIIDLYHLIIRGIDLIFTKFPWCLLVGGIEISPLAESQTCHALKQIPAFSKP